MKFCPKCGGLMMPIRKDGKTVLRCTKCGYEMAAGSSTEYRIGVAISSGAHVHTTSLISEGRVRHRSKEEIEQEKEEYYRELFLELLKEEEYGGEES